MAVMAAAILAAGMGTRMRSDLPKVLHPLAGRPMLGYVVDLVNSLAIERTVVVVGFGREQVQRFLGDKIETAVQKELLGTGHAIMQIRDRLEGFCDDVLILYGDTPLLSAGTIHRLVGRHRNCGDVCTLLTAILDDPFGYGRIVRRPDGKIERIVEEVAATPEQKLIREINGGICCFRTEKLFWALDRIKLNEKKKEYFLTDCIAVLAAEGLPVDSVTAEDREEILGVNSPEQLAQLEEIMSRKKRKGAVNDEG